MQPRVARLAVLFAAFFGGLVVCLGAIAAITGWGSGQVRIQAASIGGPFSLIDQNGETFTDKELRGKSFLVPPGITY